MKSGSLKSVSVRVGSHLAVRELSADISPGITAIVGPSGAGKSTLIKAMCGLLPFEGQIVLRDDVTKTRVSEQATYRAYVPQATHLPFAFQVADIVAMGRMPHDDPPHRALGMAKRTLRELGLDHLQDRYFPTLSGGEQLRVIVARALCQLIDVENGWLFLDEPTSSLDIANSLILMEALVQATSARSLHIVVILHDLNLAARFADQVWLLKGGLILARCVPSVALTSVSIMETFGVSSFVSNHPVDDRPVVIPTRTLT